MQWARLDALAASAANRVCGEPVCILPTVVSQHKGAAGDPDRNACQTIGRFSLAPDRERMAGLRQGTQIQGVTRLSTAVAFLVIEAKDYRAIGYSLRSGDRIRFPEPSARGAYVIETIAFADSGTALIDLVLEFEA